MIKRMKDVQHGGAHTVSETSLPSLTSLFISLTTFPEKVTVSTLDIDCVFSMVGNYSNIMDR